MSNYTFYGIRYDTMRRNLGTDGTNGKLKSALTSADGIKKPNVSLTEDGFFDRYKVWNEETKSFEVKTNKWNMFNNWKNQIDNYCTTVGNIITCRGTIRSIYSRYSTYISDLQFIKSRTNRFDSQAAAIFNLKSVADALNSFCADGLANFTVGIDEEGNEVIMYKWVDEETGDIKYLKLYEMLNAGISLTGQTMTAEVAAEVLFDGKTPDEIKEIMINAVNNQIEMTNRGLDLGIFGVTEEADALEIYKDMFQDKYPELANVKSIDEVYKIMNIDPPKVSDLGLPQEILSQLGENVEVFAGLVVTSLDVAGAYILDEDTGEKKYDVGMNVDFENVEYGKNVEGPYVISDDKDYADIKEKMDEGKTFEEAVKEVEQERIDNGEAPEDAAIKLTKDGKEEIIAPDGMTPEELGAGKEDPSVLGEGETEPTGEQAYQQPTGGYGGGGGAGGSGGGGYSYTSDTLSGEVPTTPTSAVPGGETSIGGDAYTGTTGRTPITDIIKESTPSTESLEQSLNESTGKGALDFGSKNYDELALEEYSSAGDQVKAAGILAAVAEANELFDTNPTQLYSKLQQMGYNDNQINDIMSDRELTKQAFADNKQRDDLAKLAEEKAKANGDENYKSEYSNKKKSVDDIKKENDLINSEPECANAKNELDAAVNEYKTAVEEANSALTEAKTLKAELDKFTSENGTDVDKMTDEQYNKYTELANKYNDAVDNANKKIETVSQTKENCIKAQEKYDAARLKAKENLNNQASQNEPTVPTEPKESVGVSDNDLLNSLNGNNDIATGYEQNSQGNSTSALFTGNASNSQANTSMNASVNIEEPNSLGLNVTVPTAQNVLESSTDLPTVTVATSSEVLGGNAPLTEVSVPGNFVKDSAGISNDEILASVAVEDAENKKSKLNQVEQASGIGLVGLGAVALARNASDKKEISNMIKEHQANQQVSQPSYTQTTDNEVNHSISNVLQSAGVKSVSMGTNIPMQNTVAQNAPTTDFDAGIKEEFAKSVIGSRVDLVTKAVSEASERFTFDKNLFKEDLKSLNYSDEDIELLMSNEELAIVAILDGKVRENLSKKANEVASQNGVLDYVSKYDTGRTVVELANGTVFDFLKEELAGVESGLDITTRSKLKRIFNDENQNKE